MKFCYFLKTPHNGVNKTKGNYPMELLKDIAITALSVLVAIVVIYLAVKLLGKVLKSVIVVLCVLAILVVVYFVFIKSAAPAPVVLSLPTLLQAWI